MAEITAKMVKDLREMSGAGPLDCKKALEMHDGDMNKAADWLREKGIAKATKKLNSGRTMNEGVIESYLHFNARLGVMVEVNCETDFVANTPAFRNFAKDLALHIANLAPQYLRREDVPQEVIEHEKGIQLRMLQEDPKNANKPADILEKIVQGRMDKFYSDIVLMEQAFLKDDSKTIAQLLQEVVAEVGESIQISRFARFALGENASHEGESAE
ncbi:MAG: translation elongation factor Ts [Phototrophicales bacterium]|nr:MAG: translation elongation factor Ts [Phototrophicales bacterium]